MDTTERREAVASLSSAPVAFYDLVADATPATPVLREEVASDVLNTLLAREPLEKLEAANKFSRAKWKLQIWIKSDRSIHKPLTFTLTFWESGKRLHGGGDESAFICRRNTAAPKPVKPPFGALGRSSLARVATPDGCNGVIPGDVASGGFIVCPHCGAKWDTEHIADSLFYTQTVSKAAETIAAWFRELGNDCDIYVKFRPEDIRVRMMAQTYGLAEAIRLKGMVIYPLVHIIQDTVNGATVASRIKSLLLA